MPKRRLKTIEDARRYLSGLINRTERGEVDPGLAGKLGYLCAILIRAIEGSDLEGRVSALEAKVKGGIR